MKGFLLGCNYWASNGGMRMWEKFSAEVVEKDFQVLSACGVDTIRVFPTWDAFQPIEDTKIKWSKFRYRINDQPLQTQGGLDAKQMQNFSVMLTLAEKYHLKVIVALITGWMSGGMFVPPFLQGKDLIASPKAIVWECRFIREFIQAFKDNKAIIAWEPGNECNAMSFETNEEQNELWLSAITATIRAADPTRPVYAGMHSLTSTGDWNLFQVGAYTDMQTTHPYPAFTMYCNNEPLTCMRASLHAAAESTYYAGIAQQPCMVEEIGTLGPIRLNEELEAEYLEKALVTSYQFGTSGFLWWCAFDQDKFDFAPYDVIAMEQNLGLFKIDGTPKPISQKMKAVKKKLDEIGQLPTPKKHALVILTNSQDEWAVAYGSFMLATHAGFSVDFAYETQDFGDYDYYILPCLTGSNGIPKRQLEYLLERVEKGAKLLITYHSGYIGRFEELTGLKSCGYEITKNSMSISLDDKEIEVPAIIDLHTQAVTAEVLAGEKNRTLFTKNAFGAGEIYFLNAPIELEYSKAHYPEELGYSAIYTKFFGKNEDFCLMNDKTVVTFHELSKAKTGVFVTNFSGAKEISYKMPCGRIENEKFCKVVDGKIVFENTFAYFEIIKE